MKYPLKTKKNNKSGIVLITVVIIIFTLMILAVGLLSTNTNQALMSQHQIDRIKAEQLAKGAFWYNYHNLTASAGALPPPPTETMDGKTYSITQTNSVGTGPNGTDTFSFQVSN
ncbi:MAG: hypothetical protein WC676_06300 [Candidatus Omnitrophota bacterium]